MFIPQPYTLYIYHMSKHITCKTSAKYTGSVSDRIPIENPVKARPKYTVYTPSDQIYSFHR